MKIIHLTDTHFGYTGQKIYQRSPKNALEKAVESINLEHGDADMLIITGDLAHAGHPEAYANLQSTLSQLSIPYHLVIGNHDDRPTLSKTFSTFEFDENGFAQKCIQTEQGLFILLDTVKEGTHAGYYCEKRFDWLKTQLEANAGQSVYLFMHHAPFDTGIPAMDAISLDKTHSLQLGELLDHYSNVKHIFFGHYHRPIAGQWRGIAFSTLRGMNHQVRLDLHDKHMIQGNFEEPQYCVVLLENDRTLVHYHDYMYETEEFEIGNPLEAHI
ncbi:phosphodiesterase [Vibrio comitans]|uniref:3',5'-cyclic adenosine monophosphate phosphodiesterase CpdA n=1 Tax=Vibrio comitans NBRC 102076 TaxID=1219078 RepID=A0A4Y3II85_9VIBR|nr:phosphodiesterase [Vibrio comitans]GEA59127.1 3',5'-cyclic adenosine monophosphate phosphodiesterase CpdA [Vibrio comitans NBRC 102076]